MSNFFCECKDSGEPPCFGLVQLRADLAAREAELAAMKPAYDEQLRASHARELVYVKAHEEMKQRAEAAERERDEWKKEAEDARAMSMDVSEWKRKAEEAARDAGRYRWMRDNMIVSQDHPMLVFNRDGRLEAFTMDEVIIGESFDHAIDSAIEAKGEA